MSIESISTSPRVKHFFKAKNCFLILINIYITSDFFSPLIFTQFARDKHRRPHRLRGAFRSRFLVCLLLVFTVNTFYLRVLNVNRKFHWFNPRCSHCDFITENCVEFCYNFGCLQKNLTMIDSEFFILLSEIEIN